MIKPTKHQLYLLQKMSEGWPLWYNAITKRAWLPHLYPPTTIWLRIDTFRRLGKLNCIDVIDKRCKPMKFRLTKRGMSFVKNNVEA